MLRGDLEQTVDDLWRAAQARVGGGMFNGRIFCVERLTPALITGHWTEFRRLVAQFEQPALFARLGVRPLSVNGVLVCADGVAFGQRSKRAIYQAGLWQLAPAGSIDPDAAGNDGAVDVLRQAALELREEVGLAFDTIHEAEPIAVIEHPISHVCDLGIVLRTRLTAQDVLAAHAREANAEYESIRIVSRQDISAFAAWAGDGMARQSRMLLERLGWLTTTWRNYSDRLLLYSISVFVALPALLPTQYATTLVAMAARVPSSMLRIVSEPDGRVCVSAKHITVPKVSSTTIEMIAGAHCTALLA